MREAFERRDVEYEIGWAGTGSFKIHVGSSYYTRLQGCRLRAHKWMLYSSQSLVTTLELRSHFDLDTLGPGIWLAEYAQEIWK